MANDEVVAKPGKAGKIFLIWLTLFVLPIGLWWGIPTYRKEKADSMVDELCAKDGGIKVYETVRLPASRFDQYGNVRVPSLEYKKAEDEFYYTIQSTWIIPGAGDPNDLVIWRSNHELFRSGDGKKLGEATYYARRGGDPLSISHPSGYRCPNDVGIEKKLFVRY